MKNLKQQSLSDLYGLTEKTGKRVSSLQDHNIKILTSVIQKIQQSFQSLNKQQVEEVNVKKELEVLNSQLVQIKPLSNLNKNNQDIYSKISRLGKQIDKRFNADQYFKNPFQNIKTKNMEQCIIQYYLKQKNIDAVNILDIPYEYRVILLEGIHLFNQTSKGNYEPALQWAANQKILETHNNYVQFQIRKQQFVKLIKNNQIQQAISYGEVHFKNFLTSKSNEIQKLFGFLYFHQHDTSKRYQYLLKYEDENLAKDVLRIHFEVNKNQINKINPLDICLKAGLKSETVYKKHEHLIKSHDKKFQFFPFEIKNDEQFHFHSLFVCPVTKQLSHNGEKPLVLKCGHAISQTSFNSIVENRTKLRFKCPVCHSQQRLTDVVEMHF